MRHSVHFTVNGQSVELTGDEAISPLSDTLRYGLGRTGTKVVCAEGDCGACTVLVARAGENGANRFRSLNSCILPAFLVDGCHVVTVEGLEEEGKLHEVQRAMIDHFGGQCGFCTPGFVMSLVNLFEQKPTPTERNIRNALTGNLCRCTGYLPILEAALNVDARKIRSVGERYGRDEEPLLERTRAPLLVETGEREVFGPRTLEEAIPYLDSHPDARIFSGATDLGVQINKGRDPGRRLLSLAGVESLRRLEVDQGRIHVGARVTLDRLENVSKTHLPALARFLSIFASPQIKNSATLVGNLANGSPIADTTPFLMAVDARVRLVSSRGKREIPVSGFFKGYKSFAMEPGELIEGIEFEVPDPTARLSLYKASQRRDLDISCVNAAFRVEEKGGRIEKARIAFGGVGPVPLRLAEVEKILTGAPLTKATVRAAAARIPSAVSPISDVRGSREFRTLLAVRLFERFASEELRV